MDEVHAKEAEIGLCLLVAHADGLSKNELSAIQKRLVELFGEQAGADAVIDREWKQIRTLDRAEYIERLKLRLAPDQRARALEAAIDVGFADGISPEEETSLRAIADALGVDRKAVEDIIGPPEE